MEGTAPGNVALDPEAFLASLIGHAVAVYTMGRDWSAMPGHGASHSGPFIGRLHAQSADTLILETPEPGQASGKRVLIYKRAIVAIAQLS